MAPVAARSILVRMCLALLLSSLVALSSVANVSSPAGPAAVEAAGQWTNGYAADVALGQIDFTGLISGTTPSTMQQPRGVVVDPMTGKVFVSEMTNNRILRFASTGAWTNGQAAEGVLGQADFTSASPNRGNSTTPPAANSLYYPFGMHIDAAGRLWVADYNNSRVLRFDGASSKGNGADADGVLGQADFVHKSINRGAPAPGAETMSYPDSVWVDASGSLWVSEEGNNRILRFDNAAAKSAGADADGVLGQADFTHGGFAMAQNRMQVPTSVVVTQGGSLFVADYSNHRVLRFDHAAAKVNGADADGVLGQTDFTTATEIFPPTQSSLRNPWGLGYEENGGRLFVAERDMSRVLIFENAVSKPNGADADNVLGQADFTSWGANPGGRSAATLNWPWLVFFDNASNVLWVADGGNKRVLRYNPIPSSTSVTLSSSLNPSRVGQSVTFSASVTVTAGLGVPGGSVQLKIDGANAGAPLPLTNGIVTYTTAALAPGTHAITAAYPETPGFGPAQATLAGGQVVSNWLLMLPFVHR